MLTLAKGFATRGLDVELILACAEGPLLEEIPQRLQVVDLQVRRVATSLPNLVRYLRRTRPRVLLSTHSHANVIALWAKRLSGVATRVIVREANTSSVSSANSRRLRDRIMPALTRRFYPWADGVVAPSKGVLEDLVQSGVVSPERISLVFSPAVTRDVFELSAQPLEHPWFCPKVLPVVVTAGRLTRQKDLECLIRAFSRARRKRPMKLVILGEGEERPKLEHLIDDLGMESDIDMPGFVKNPFSYMRQADLYVLSSAWEGLPNALIQAMGCGTPVVSTDCPSGPAEILDDGRYGRLVAVGDVEALADAILATIDQRSDVEFCESLITRSMCFSEDVIVDQYLDVLFPKAGESLEHFETRHNASTKRSN